jgi:hypothetical protein
VVKKLRLGGTDRIQKRDFGGRISVLLSAVYEDTSRCILWHPGCVAITSSLVHIASYKTFCNVMFNCKIIADCLKYSSSQLYMQTVALCLKTDLIY